VAAAHRATVKDHAGDGVLILVGAPLPVKNSTEHAARLAQQLMRTWQTRRAGSFPGLGLGIGVATGVVTIGAIQGAGRLEYVAVGNAVNLASRLCNRAEDGQILIDEETYAGLAASTSQMALGHSPELLKGFTQPVPVYSLASETAAS
jgi:class 3 adenylate cyclase